MHVSVLELIYNSCRLLLDSPFFQYIIKKIVKPFRQLWQIKSLSNLSFAS